MTSILIALALSLPALQDVAKAKVLIVGTYHMANPNQDLIKTDWEDVLTERRQRELEDLATRLAEFRPTRVALEVEPAAMAPIDREYRQYVKSRELPRSRNEIHQLGFRIARLAGLEHVHGVDVTVGLDMQPMLERAKGTRQGELLDRALDASRADQAKLKAIERDGTIGDMIRSMNDRSSDAAHGTYLIMATIGDAEHPVGADVVARWYERNLKIFANVARLAESEKDRVLVLIGAGHGPLLREMVRQCPLLELADVSEYLD